MRGYLLKSATSGVANVAVSAAATLIALPLVISHVGLETYGVWAMLGIFISLAAVLDMGLTRAIVYLALKQKHETGELFSAAVCVALLTAIAATLIVMLLMWLKIDLPGFSIGVSDDSKLSLLVAGCIVLTCSQLNSVLRAFLEATYSVHIVNIGFLLLTVVQYGVALCIAYSSGRAPLLLLGSAATHLAILLFHAGALMQRANLRFGPLRAQVLRNLVRQGLSYFAAGSPTVILMPLILCWLSVVATSAEEYGRFDIALRFATMAGTAVSLIAVPLHAVTAGMKPPSRSAISHLLARYMAVTFGALIAGWLLFAFIGKELLTMLAASAEPEIWRACTYLLIGVGLFSAMEPIFRVSMGLGRLMPLFAARATVFGITVLALIALHALPPVERFSLGYAVGCTAGAIAALLLLPSLRASIPSAALMPSMNRLSLHTQPAQRQITL